MTTKTNGPLATVLLAAIDAAKIAEQAYDECDCDTWLTAARAADASVDEARAALIASDEEIEWDVSEEGNDYMTVWASSAAEALKLVTADYDASCYGEIGETIVVTVRVTNDLIDETDTDTVTIDPPAPDCADGCEHDWHAPHSVVGGIAENPGCWSSGHGSVRCKSVCALCGVYRVIDHGGTDRSNGTQLTTTSYEDADESSLAWVAEENK